MKFQRLSSLLLSGCLSVSGFGCAAFQATLEPPRPISDSRDTSAQRLVAIARIFENQGKYERAETMYRRALRHRPTDTVVRDRIDHLVARRHGQQFSAGPSTTAIAAADAVSGSRTRTSARPAESRVLTASATATNKAAEVSPMPTKTVAQTETTPAEEPSAAVPVKETAEVSIADVDAPAPSEPLAVSELPPIEPPETPSVAPAAEPAMIAAAPQQDPAATVTIDDAQFEWTEIAPLPPEPAVMAAVEETAEAAAAETDIAEVQIAEAEESNVVLIDTEQLTSGTVQIAELQPEPPARITVAADPDLTPVPPPVETIAATPASPTPVEATLADSTPAPLWPADATPAEAPAAEVIETTQVIDAEEVPPLRSTPADRVAMLIRTLEPDNLPEERAIAAVLLGESPRDDIRVRIALDHCCSTMTDMTLLLAVCDSQIQRGEQSIRTAECLTTIARRAEDSELRVQAVSALRHFADTELSNDCANRLFELLSSANSDVRTAAAFTLGDFTTRDGETISQLTLAAANDTDASVRQAALHAMERIGQNSSEMVEVINVTPPGSYRTEEPIEIVPARW